MRNRWIFALIVLALVPKVASAEVLTPAQLEALRWPSKTLRLMLPERILKVDRTLHPAVADVTALGAIPAAEQYDGKLVIVRSGPHLYTLDSDSGVAADGDLVVDAAGAGNARWVRLDGAGDAPVTHALTHATGGGDDLTPAAIGAATAAQGGLADSALQPGDVDAAAVGSVPAQSESAFTPVLHLSKAFVAGEAGAADDVTVLAAGELPFGFEVVLVGLYVSGGADAGRSVALRTQAAGAGTLLATLSAEEVDWAMAPPTTSSAVPGATEGLFLRRSHDAVAGTVMVLARKVVPAE